MSVCQLFFAEINVLSTSSDSYIRGVLLTGDNTALRNATCPKSRTKCALMYKKRTFYEISNLLLVNVNINVEPRN